MTQTAPSKQKPIKKTVKAKSKNPHPQSSTSIAPSTQPTSSTSQVLRGVSFYRVEKTIYEKASGRGKVAILRDQEGRQFIGKFFSNFKQHLVIFESFFLRLLKSPSICNLIELIKVKEGYWIVMEKGHMTLHQYLPSLQSSQVLPILRNIVMAYSTFWEKGISHRDLKLSNMIIDPATLQVKLIDLELCEKSDHVYGTPEFVPPEIIKFHWSICDSYAFGIVANKLIETCTRKEVDYQPDQRFKQLVGKCMQKDPIKRWSWPEIFAYFQNPLHNEAEEIHKVTESRQRQILSPSLNQTNQ